MVSRCMEIKKILARNCNLGLLMPHMAQSVTTNRVLGIIIINCSLKMLTTRIWTNIKSKWTKEIFQISKIWGHKITTRIIIYLHLESKTKIITYKVRHNSNNLHLWANWGPADNIKVMGIYTIEKIITHLISTNLRQQA